MAMIHFECTRCRSGMSAEERMAGENVRCGHCGAWVEVPYQVVVPDAAEETLSFLESIEVAFRRMIVGVFRFIGVRLPLWIYDLFRDFFNWLGRAARFLVRFTIRFVRVAATLAVWLALVFGPLGLALGVRGLRTPGFLIAGGVWAALGLAGSVWGLVRWKRQRALALAQAHPVARPAYAQRPGDWR